MARRRSATLQFNAIRLVGGLLPASLIEQIARQEAPGQKASDYGLPKNLRLQVAVDQAWVTARALWQEAKELSSRGEDTPWRVWFSSRLLREVFVWDDLASCEPRRIEEALYPISHQAFGGKVPLVLTPVESELLDQGSKAYGQDGRRRSPHSCLQECLNADDSSDWGVLCNGTTLRLLHDNPALVKPAYVQVELGAILDGGLFDEFAVLWLLLQASRFQCDGDGHCRLDAWLELGQQSGERALNRLRDGVQSALEALGEGFIRHPANQELVRQLEDGELSTMDFFRQLLRLVYRLLFLCAAEDRTLLFPPGVPFAIQQVYREGYSLSRLRDLSIRSGAQEHQHSDLWKVQVLMFRELEKETGSELGLPALGGLFNQDRCPDLDTAQLSNAALLAAVRAIGWFYDEQSQSRTRINYAAMNTEEFGSVYESLLELHPQVRSVGGGLRFSLGGVAGSERKTSGSYYTPEDLVRLLILSALLPVIRDRLSKATTPEEKEAALLAIRVLDPACGSGHFLLAAARRLALELARIKAGDDEPSEELRRECLRKVVARCIYGVDKNPMAVELCKVALWIEAIEPGKPLGFLDAHIQCGDSLVGVFDPKVLDEGIPDGAYKPLTGDKPATCNSLKKVNKKQREAYEKTKMMQPSLDLFREEDQKTSQTQLTEIEALPEETLTQTLAKQQRYEQWQAELLADPEQLAADLYTAAFFLSKDEATQISIPLTEHLLVNDPLRAVPLSVQKAARQAARDFNFFHWHLRFSQVMKNGGFDCVLGNPPWERIKLQEKEFFASRSEAIATAPNKAARERLIQELRSETASQADRLLVQEFELAKREAEGSGEFIRSSGRFALTAVGDLNTYALFAEHCLKLIASEGRAGVIVPTGIVTDNSTKAYFDEISGKSRLVSLISFENEAFIFKSVHHSYKFCLLTLRGNERSDAQALFAFYIRELPQLSEASRFFQLSAQDISLLSPNTRTCPVFRSQADAELARKIYKRVPVFFDQRNCQEGDPWGIKYATLFHMSNDSGLFLSSSQLREMGAIRTGSNWRFQKEEFIPMYEARMIGNSCHKLSSFDQGAIDRGFRVLPPTPEERMNDPMLDGEPFYWVNLADHRERCERLPGSVRFAFKNITASSNERTLIGCFLPSCFSAADTLPIVCSNHPDPTRFACAMQGMNSLVVDFCARQKVSGLHLTLGILQQLPVLSPYLISDSDKAFLIPRLVELNIITYSQMELANSLGVSLKQPYHWNPHQRPFIHAELDAFYAHLYGLSRDELRYILDPADVMGPDYPSETFRVLKNNEIRQFGEYRTQRLVLEAWDRLFGV